MTAPDGGALASHPRAELPEERRSYRPEPELLRLGLERADARPCDVCDATCCKSGVYLSLPHRDLLLRHAEVIRRHMDSDQATDPAQWFEAEVLEDEDFEGGRCVGTEMGERGCVFLNREGRCVLQLASDRELELPRLKPFFCRLFPLTVVDGEVTFDDHCQGERPCCTAVEGGGIALLEACAAECDVVFGPEETRRLVARARALRGRAGEEPARSPDRDG